MIGSNPIFSNSKKNELLDVLKDKRKFIFLKSLEKFEEISSMKIFFGFEIEFYIRSSDGDEDYLDEPLIQSFLKLVTSRCSKIDIFDKIELEKGYFQFEIKTNPGCDVVNLLKGLDLINEEIKSCCDQLRIYPIYDPRPFSNDCANAFQINFSLLNKDNLNIFSDRSEISAQIASFITNHLGELFIFSNENDEDFARYDSSYNKSIFKKGKFVAPTSKSWGYDNRTCAVRVLNASSYKNDARIEIRVPSNNSDKYLLISSLVLILKTFFSLDENNQIENQNIYGNSFDDKYPQKKFPKNYQEALDCFFDDDGVVLQEVFLILDPSLRAL